MRYFVRDAPSRVEIDFPLPRRAPCEVDGAGVDARSSAKICSCRFLTKSKILFHLQSEPPHGSPALPMTKDSGVSLPSGSLEFTA